MAMSETVVTRSRAVSDPLQLILPSQRERGYSKLLSQVWFKSTLFLSSDVVAIWLAHQLAESLMHRWLGESPAYLNSARYSVFYVLSFIAVLYLFGGYRNSDSRRPERELELGFKSISFFFAALASMNFLVSAPQHLSLYLVSCWYGTSLLLVVGARFGLRGIYHALWHHDLARETTLLAGPACRVADLMRHLSVQRHLRYKVLGALIQNTVNPSDPEKTHVMPPILGLLEDWEGIVDQF